MRARKLRRCLLIGLSCIDRRRMRLRPQSSLAQGESLRPAPQVFRRDETGRGERTAPSGAAAEGQLNTELVPTVQNVQVVQAVGRNQKGQPLLETIWTF